jgi:hypothetical protein
MSRTTLRLIAAFLLVASLPLLLYSLLLIAFRNDEGGNATIELAGNSYDAGTTGFVALTITAALIAVAFALFRRSSRS